MNPNCIIYKDYRANNVLEFLVMAISIWLSLLECKQEGLTQENILALGDNTSAICWIMKSGKMKKNNLSYSAVKFIARKVVTLMAELENFLDTQHLKGELNCITDWLSFQGKERYKRKKLENGNLGGERLVFHPVAYDCPSNNELTHRLLTFFPQDVPNGFRISHLTVEIFLFAQQSAQILKESLIQREKRDMKITTGSGAGGPTVAKASSCCQTPLLEEYPQERSGLSQKFSLKSTGKQNLMPNWEKFLDNVRSRWREGLSARPQQLWLRRSGTVTNGTP